MAKPLQASFTGGEISPLLRQRVDLALYGNALAACRNFIVRRTGGVTTRGGTIFVARAAAQDARSRFLRFVFSRQQAYLVQMSPAKAYFVANGAPVVSGTVLDVLEIADDGANTTIVTDGAHGLLTGRLVALQGFTGETAGLNDTWTITVISSTAFQVPCALAAPPNNFGTPTATPVAFVTTPYDQDEIFAMRVAQSADVQTQVCRTQPPHELSRTSGTAFNHEEVEYDTGPFQRDNTDESYKIHASATRGSVTLTSTRDLFTAAHVGALIRIEEEASDLEPWEPANGVSIGDFCRYNGNAYVCVGGTGITTGNSPPTHTRGREKDGQGSHAEWEYLHSGYGVARITAYLTAKTVTAKVLSRLPGSIVGGTTTAQGPWTMTGDGSDVTLAVAAATSNLSSDYEVTFDGVIQSPDDYTVNSSTDVMTFAEPPATGVAVSAKQLATNRRTTIWALGAWSEVQGYPGAVAYYGNRLVFGGTTAEPQRLDLSETDDYSRFRKSNPAVDTDGFDRRLGGRDMSGIVDMLPMGSLIVTTDGGAHRLRGGDQDTVTPTNTGVRPLDAVPAADATGVLAGKKALYIERGGRRLWALSVDAAGDSEANEITLKVDHLIPDGYTLDGMDYARLPDQMLWLHRSDGAFPSLTYLPEQEVEGWALHTTQGEVEQFCVVPEGNRDTVYLLVKREVDGEDVRYIEKMSVRDQRDQRDIICVDSAVTYDGRNTTAHTVMLTGTTWQADSNHTATFSGGTALTADDIGRFLWVYDRHGNPVRCEVTAVLGLLATVVPDGKVPTDLWNYPTTNWGWAATRITGLTHLRNCDVAVQVDGAVYEAEVTVDEFGGITLDRPAVVVHVGLPFECYLETLAINYPGRETVRATPKAIAEVAVLVAESKGLEAGPDESNLENWPGRAPTDDWDVPELYTGLAEVTINRTWEDSGKIQIWQRQPAPLTVLAVIPTVRSGTGA